MRDLAGLIKSEVQYERLINLCARELGTIGKFIDLGLITDAGDGKYKVKVMYRKYYLYSMIYDGSRILECARLFR